MRSPNLPNPAMDKFYAAYKVKHPAPADEFYYYRMKVMMGMLGAAMLVAGGSSYFTRNELSRLYRDVLAGMFHPSDPESAHATVAAAWLGPVSS